MVKWDNPSMYVQKTIGKCLTEYTHPMYDELVKECTGFVITPLEARSHSGYPIVFEPKCGIMECCYGLLPNTDDVVKLKYIIDSSD